MIINVCVFVFIRRGLLSQTLHKIRFIAKNEYKHILFDDISKHTCIPCNNNSNNSNKSINKSNVNDSIDVDDNISSNIDDYSNDNSDINSNNNTSNSNDKNHDINDNNNDNNNDEKINKNFRELLWFWSEYYLRRGRDRLSLEFSSHFPFCEWKHVIG